MSSDIGIKGNLIIAAFALAAFVAIRGCQQEDFTAQDGIEYLAEHGYRNIEGGEIDAWNLCAKGELARRYIVDGDGLAGREEVVVCNGFGTRISPF